MMPGESEAEIEDMEVFEVIFRSLRIQLTIGEDEIASPLTK